MMHIKIKLIIRFASVLILLWVIAMIVYPILSTYFDWLEIQNIWDRWQTLNSGMIALVAAMIAIYAAQYTENARRQRELIAARALLPLALSELHNYCSAIAAFITLGYQEWRADPVIDKLPTDNKVPDKPSSWVFEAFKNCMVHTNENEAKFMASILSDVQIIDARTHSLKEGENLIIDSTFSGLGDDLCEIHAKLGRMFEYSRTHSSLLTTDITSEEKSNSVLVLDIEYIPKY